MSDLFKVNTNVNALRALNTLQNINDRIVETQERISTGRKVNRASDNPATFFVSRLYETSISALVANQVEIERGIDWLETNNARLDQAADIIIEITDLVNTANSGSITSSEQQAISREMKLLIDAIDNILNSGVSTKLFTSFTIGALSSVSISGGVPTTNTLNIQTSDLVVTGTATQFTTSINNLSSALNSVLEIEENVGAYVHRLEFELDDLSATEIADRASLSTIIDADLAEEQVALSSLQILQQTSLVGLMQANSAPSAILGLIQG
ncbi:MAG: flagellin [Candidatus Heimdallarchaeota archaeon]|nr:flagellin [Candidatus Heimdallarchaeota archaeon]